MSAENYEASLRKVLVHEGGYSNDRNDPGGQTMWGITHWDYDAYRRINGLQPQDVRRMAVAERDAIYKKKYWTGSRCDELPSGVDYAVFDGAVNSGVAQSVKWMQRALGNVAVDGHVGDHTLLAANDADPGNLIRSICVQRRKFLQALRTFPTFGRGWMRRVNEVESSSVLMSDGHPYVEHEEPATDTGAKAATFDIARPSVEPGAATSATVATGGASALVQQAQDTLAPYSDAITAIKYVLIVLTFVGICFTIYSFWKTQKAQEVT
jgi:lysozyme family protein